MHVSALAQHTDRSSVEPGGVFHVTIHAKIAQRRDRLDELILGAFMNCEIISNETVRTLAPDGTDFTERLTVQALAPGEATISPAYIDALDPAIGRPMRYSSNAIRVHVAGVAATAGGSETIGDIARRLALAAAIVAGMFAAAFVLVVVFVRRKRGRPVAAPAPVVVAAPVPPAPAGTGNERLSAAAAAFRSAPSDVTLSALRGVLFGLAGVAAGATLVDALRGLGDRDEHLRRALVAAEAATFGPAEQRRAAGADLLIAVDAYRDRNAAQQDAWTR